MRKKTLIILDWDDTLFPTSWSIRNNIDFTKKEVRDKYIVFFAKLDLLLYKLFINLLRYGQIYIVTNAMTKWIVSSSRILPFTQKLLKFRVNIMSARDLHQNSYPNDSFMWKKLVFEDIINNNVKANNIISIGDAEYEYKALINLHENDNRLLKAIKFVQNPSFDTVIDQLQVLKKSIKLIVANNDHMDLLFSDN